MVEVNANALGIRRRSADWDQEDEIRKALGLDGRYGVSRARDNRSFWYVSFHKAGMSHLVKIIKF